MITVDKLGTVEASINKLIEQTRALVADIAETAQDRARLLTEAEQREAVVDKLNSDLDEARQRIIDLEARNSRLVDDTVRLEVDLADAIARLDTISVTARRDLDTREVGEQRYNSPGNTGSTPTPPTRPALRLASAPQLPGGETDSRR